MRCGATGCNGVVRHAMSPSPLHALQEEVRLRVDWEHQRNVHVANIAGDAAPLARRVEPNTRQGGGKIGAITQVLVPFPEQHPKGESDQGGEMEGERGEGGQQKVKVAGFVNTSLANGCSGGTSCSPS